MKLSDELRKIEDKYEDGHPHNFLLEIGAIIGAHTKHAIKNVFEMMGEGLSSLPEAHIFDDEPGAQN